MPIGFFAFIATPTSAVASDSLLFRSNPALPPSAESSFKNAMKFIKQYDVFKLARDINPVIKKGMKGVILEIWKPGVFEVEFVKDDATNYEFEGQSTFTLTIQDMQQNNSN